VGGLIDPSDQVFLTKFSKLCRLTNNLIHLADPFQSLPTAILGGLHHEYRWAEAA
jgi:hypothetical protein